MDLIRGIDPRTSKDLAIAAVAGPQNGNVTHAQLRSLGLSEWEIAHRVKTGRLFRVHTGVYSVGRPPRTPLEKASAAVLACGPIAALSHRSALALWGLVNEWTFPLEITVTRDRRPRGINVHLCQSLSSRDVKTHLGIRVTTRARAILDCAPDLPAPLRTRIINDARGDGHLHPATVADLVNRYPNHRGTKYLRPILDPNADGPTDSPFEDDLRDFCLSYDIPLPVFGRYIAGHRVDAVYPKQKLIIECDGWRFHNSRESFESDRDRDADTLAAGYATVRLTRRRMQATPEREADRLRTILAARTES